MKQWRHSYYADYAVFDVEADEELFHSEKYENPHNNIPILKAGTPSLLYRIDSIYICLIKT